MKKIILLGAIAFYSQTNFAQVAGQALIGVGFKIDTLPVIKDMHPKVIGFKPDYPAEKVLKVGDFILKIDDWTTKNIMTDEEILKHLRGQDSTEAILEIWRDNKKMTIPVMRKRSTDASVAGKCLKGNCINGEGLWQDPYNNKYEGTFKGGVPHGQSKMVSGTGDRFEGNFINGKRDGTGKIIKKNTETWEGNFTNDKPNGKFAIKYANGDLFDGDFTNGLMTGKGKKIFKNGDIWEGDFVNGKLEGNAKVIQKIGDTYEGRLEAGKKNGWGKLQKGKNFLYEGMFKVEKRIGYGAYTYLENTPGKRVEGEFVAERCKKGTVYYEAAEKKIWKYEGEIDSESRPNALKGKIYYRDGKWEEGKFVNGKLEKQTDKGALAIHDTKNVKVNDKEALLASERVLTEIDKRLAADGYAQESKITSKANAFASLSGETGYIYVVAAVATAKANLFAGTIGNKEKADMPSETPTDDKVRLLYQIRDGEGTPIFATASAFVKGDDTDVIMVVWKKKK
jgi:hypothetical protein